MSLETEIQNALKVLREGGAILYPTDTIWGIGCDATNEKAVEKVLEIKKRQAVTPTLKGESRGKSFIVLVSDPGMLNRFVKDVPEMAWDIMDANSVEDDDEPVKPITIIYDAARGLAKNVLAEDESIGIRMVTRERNDFCHRLIHKFGRPVVSTSANISGEPAPQDFSEISDEIISNVDYVVKLHTPNSVHPTASSIIKLKANGEFKIIRE
jgi:L-threonylcarbamoyladenylate synthase